MGAFSSFFDCSRKHKVKVFFVVSDPIVQARKPAVENSLPLSLQGRGWGF